MLLTAVPFFVIGATWRLPDTYHSAGSERGTATLKFYEDRDMLCTRSASQFWIMGASPPNQRRNIPARRSSRDSESAGRAYLVKSLLGQVEAAHEHACEDNDLPGFDRLGRLVCLVCQRVPQGRHRSHEQELPAVLFGGFMAVRRPRRVQDGPGDGLKASVASW
jgi:hypothetical protein